MSAISGAGSRRSPAKRIRHLAGNRRPSLPKGIDSQKKCEIPASLNVKQKFRELYALGWTYKEIARALGVTRRTLYNWRRDLGLPNRRRGRRSNVR